MNNDSIKKFASNKSELVTYSFVVARIPAAEVDCLQTSNNDMVYTTEDKILIKNLVLLKDYSSTKS